MAAGERRAPRWTIIAIGLLTLLAALGRAINLDAGLPYQIESDTVIVTQAADLEHPKDREWRTRGYRTDFYPLLLGQVLYAMPGHSFAAAPGPEAGIEESLARATEPYLRGRLLVLLLSIPCVPLVWLLCRRWVGPEWALVAAAFMAVSFFHFEFSRSARPHGALTTACVLSLLTTLRFLRSPGWTNALLAAGAAALSVAILHSGIFVVPSLMLAALWADPSRAPRRWVRFLLGAAVLGVTVYIFYPFFFENAPPTTREGSFNFGAQQVKLNRFTFAGYALFLPNIYLADPALVVLGLLGLIPLWRRRPEDRAGRRVMWVCLAHPIATVLCFGITNHVPGRFFLPILPWFALSATFLVRALTEGAGARWPRARPVVATALVAAALAFPTAVTLRQIWLFSRPTTQDRLGQWLSDRTEKIWSDSPRTYCIPIRVDLRGMQDAPAWSMTHWLNYQFQYLRNAPPPRGPRVHSIGPPPPIEEWTGKDAEGLREWFASEVGPGLYVARRGAFVANKNPANRLLSRKLMTEAFGEPVFEDRGGSRPGEWDDPGSDFPISIRLRRLFQISRTGPAFEVWRIPGPG